MKKTICNLLLCSTLLFGIFACGKKGKVKESSPDLASLKKIELHESDISKDEIDDILELESYIKLSNDVPLGRIEQIAINDEKIFILDHEPKIVCLDMAGKVLYQINNRGPGPKEYDHITDFSVNADSKQLVALDQYKRKMFVYDLNTGEYLSSISLIHMAVSKFGMVDNPFFFKNLDHSRFDVQKEQMFYLLYSETGKEVNKMFLPHDAIAEFNFDSKSFFCSGNKLLYINPFDYTAYQLKSRQITPMYEFSLPNQLPMQKIEEKMDHMALVASDYGYGVDAIYEADQILHFTFSKSKFVTSVFYDLQTDKLLYCGIKVLDDGRKKMPFYSLVDGVYKARFFSVVSPQIILLWKESHPQYIPSDLLNINDQDNPVIAFYKIHRPV